MSLSIRNYQAADFDGLLALLNAAVQANEDLPPSTPAMLDARLNTPGCDPAQDVFVAEVPGAGLAGFSEGALRLLATRAMYFTRGAVLPAFRRQGIGRTLLEHQWSRLLTIASTPLGLPLTLAARVPESHAGAIALYTSFGMQHVRYFLEMNRDLLRPLPALDLPPGLSLRSWAAAEAIQAVLAAINEAFADHWDYVPESTESFQHRLAARLFTPEHSVIAWDGDQVAGGSLNTLGQKAELRMGRNTGWVNLLFVRRAWRGRGLGRALLAATMAGATRLGHTALGLNVDAENLTGAVHLYEAAGFRVTIRRVIFHRRLLS